MYINIGTDPVTTVNSLNETRKLMEDCIKDYQEKVDYIDFLLGALDTKTSKEKRK
jgi:hypothetical protein